MKSRTARRSWPRMLAVLATALLASIATGTVAAAAPAPTPSPAGQDSKWGFRGLLRDGDRIPVSGATVEVRTNGTVHGSAVTDQNGRWGVVAVPGPGTYVIAIDTSAASASFTNGDQYEIEKELVDSPTTLPVLSIVVSTSESAREVATLGDQLAQRAVAGLNLGLLIAIAAIGLSLVFGTSRFTNFGHGENVTFGGIMGFLFAYTLDLPLLVAAVLATVLGGLFGYLQDVVLWRPMRRKGLSLVTLMIASIGVGLALRSLFQFFFGNSARSISREDWGTVALGPVTMPVSNYVSMAISVVTLIAIGLWLKFGRLGKATRAIANNTSLAAASGIDIDAISRLVWVVAGALAALSGVLLGMFNQVSHDMGLNLLLLMFAAVILGGLGTAFGALAGALVVGTCTEVLVLWIPADMKYVGGLAILIVVLLLRPQGIFGRRERIG